MRCFENLVTACFGCNSRKHRRPSNAQSFRILTKLAFHSEDHRGLDLTRVTLAGVLKYHWKRGENSAKPKKWGAYEAEKTDFDFALALAPAISIAD